MSTTDDEASDDSPDAPAAPVSWTRLEYDDGSVIRTTELAQEGATLYVRIEEVSARSRQPEREAKIEIKTMKSAALAARSLALRVENALKREHVLRPPVLRPLPTTSTAAQRAALLQQKKDERLRRLERSEDDALAFFKAWHAAGHDPEQTFRQEAQHRKERVWNELASACVALCAEAFGVVFSGRIVVDEEHGWRGDIPHQRLADVYESPAYVARLAIQSIDEGQRAVEAYSLSWQSSSAQPEQQRDAVARALERFRTDIPRARDSG